MRQYKSRLPGGHVQRVEGPICVYKPPIRTTFTQYILYGTYMYQRAVELDCHHFEKRHKVYKYMRNIWPT